MADGAFLNPQEELSTLGKIGRGLSAFGAGVQGRGPEFLMGLQAQQQQLDDDRKRAAAEDLRRMRGRIAAGDLQGALGLAVERAQMVSQLGGDPSDTLAYGELAGAAMMGDQNALAELTRNLDEDLVAAREGGFLKDMAEGVKSFAPTRIIDPNDPQKVITVVPQVQTDGSVSYQKLGQSEKLTAQEQSDIKLAEAQAKADIGIETAGRKETETAVTKRRNALIEGGIASIESLPGINRTLELLDTVKTGGFVAAKKAATDFFGTTPASVGELNNRLAQNVLDGLSVFTGSISEGERKFLEKMKTSLSQGTDVNRALVERSAKILERKIAMARKLLEVGGDETADFYEMFKLAEETYGAQPEPAPQTESSLSLPDFIVVNGRVIENPDKN